MNFMSIRDFFKKRNSFKLDVFKEPEKQYAPKWITVSLVMSTSNKMPKETINDVAEDMANIVNNTHAIFNDKSECHGYINPYLQIDYVSMNNQVVMCESSKMLLDKPVSKTFVPMVIDLDNSESDDVWEIILAPCKESTYDDVDIYSLERLSIEMFILAGASDFICNKYGITIEDEKPTYEAIVRDNIPYLRHRDHLIVLEYSVFDRMEYATKSLDLDKFVLGTGCHTIFDFIDEIRTCKKHDPIWIEWLQKIDQYNTNP
ncbi:hypothetical protein HNV12_26230 [Methanococcoides sp. SA1]|nr:hypothetical protein [Methanococcoides sp. SA1]